MCGIKFYPNEDWKRICLPCYKKSKTPAREKEIIYINQPIPPDILNKLIRLAHPDKHGNSPVSNEITAYLLKLRETQI